MCLTNKVRLFERREQQSAPFVGQARFCFGDNLIKKGELIDSVESAFHNLVRYVLNENIFIRYFMRKLIS